MDYRPLGRTGIKVSPYCLGAMMFGAFDTTSAANAAKLDAADALGALADEAGMTLVQMVIAFVTRRPAVTSRTMFRVSTEGGSVLPI